MIIREMSSRLDFEHIESVANQSGCDWLLLEYVRGILVPQQRDMETIKLLSRWQQKIGSSFRTGEPISAYEIFLWALTALEFEESVSDTGRTASGHFLPGVERTFEQICDDRVVDVSVASSGLLEFDSSIDLGESQTEFEIQCVWICSLFLLGKKRPKWSFLQQLALSSFLEEFFLKETGPGNDAYEFDPEHIFSLGHYSCVLLPFEMAKRVLNSFHDHLKNDGKVDSHRILAFEGAQKRILGSTSSEVVETVKRIKSQVGETGQFPVAATRCAIEFDRQKEIQDGPLNVAKLQRRRRRMVPSAKSNKTVVDAIENVIGSKIGKLVSGLQVSVEGESVVVKATVPSYHVRQLVERESRSIVVSHLRKKFVSSVVVRS